MKNTVTSFVLRAKNLMIDTALGINHHLSISIIILKKQILALIDLLQSLIDLLQSISGSVG